MKLYLICLLIYPILADFINIDYGRIQQGQENPWSPTGSEGLFTYPNVYRKCEMPTLKNGKVRIMKRGRNAKFRCNPSFQLLGESYGTCLRRRWDKVPVCVKSGCVSLPPLFNGQKIDTYRGAVITFICNPGYTMVGSPQVYCDGFNWNGSLPQCTASERTPEPQCDFELPNICGWTQDPLHTFNWSRLHNQTPSRNIGTGPLFDHTLGKNKGGYYMFIETSSPRIPNDTARLFSPVYSPALTSDQPSCFTFWYHMYGATTGILNVYVKPEDAQFDGTLLPKFTKSGNQGDEWFQGYVPLPSINQSFQVIIEALCGTSYDSDIAIDDVKITSGTECSDLEIEWTSVESMIPTTSGVTVVARTQKATNMTHTYPTPPPLPTLEPYPGDDSTLINPATVPSIAKTTSNIIYTADGLTLPTVGPKFIIPTTPTPMILVPFSLRTTVRPSTVANSTTTTRTTTAVRTTVPITKTTILPTSPTTRATAAQTTTTMKVKTTTLRTTVPTNATKAPSKKPKPSTTSSTTRKATVTTRTTTTYATTTTTWKPIVIITKALPRPTTKSTKRPVTINLTTKATVPSLRTTKRITLNPIPKPTKAPKTLMSTTTEILIDKIQPEKVGSTPSQEKYRRGKEWYKNRMGPVPAQKKQGLAFSSIVGILTAVVLVLAAAGIITYIYVKKRQKARRQSGIADDSDVKFLTSDEVLDFSLARPMDDDL